MCAFHFLFCLFSMHSFFQWFTLSIIFHILFMKMIIFRKKGRESGGSLSYWCCPNFPFPLLLTPFSNDLVDFFFYFFLEIFSTSFRSFQFFIEIQCNGKFNAFVLLLLLLPLPSFVGISCNILIGDISFVWRSPSFHTDRIEMDLININQ